VLRCGDRDGLREHLERAGVPTRIHYARPLNREPMFAPPAADASASATASTSERARPCPNAERAAREVLSLPIHAFLHELEVDRAVQALSQHGKRAPRG
jgi:dTDP-4-amino-4,6-dideoxygalactose transaminase